MPETGSEGAPGAFLFLQGPLTRFYAQIAERLMAMGRRVVRVNFCGADAADWPHPGAIAYTGTPADWPAFLEQRIAPLGIATVVLHGDRRFYHRHAAAWARRHAITVAATELGYLRPDWMTLERNACSARSHFPADRATIEAVAAAVPPLDATPRFRASTPAMMAAEIRFTLYNRLMRHRFPHYRSHRPFGARRVWPGWLAAQARAPLARRRGQRLMAALAATGRRYFVLALQLEGDFQLRDHSPFASVAESIGHVAASFARAAPPDSLLAIKPHPLDAAPRRRRREIEAATAAHALGDRVAMVEGVAIDALCRHAAGFVTVNSSAGFEALAAGCPVATVMPTIYDCADLTHQGPLDAFWTAPQGPDPALDTALRRALAGTIQVRGTLHDPAGRAAAASAIAERLAADQLNHPGAFADPPPRLARAAAMGVVYDD
ncbi:MAG: capsular biosynthesis protein [Pseudomonadota bacterium]